MRINHTRIGNLLKDLNKAERIYLENVLNISNQITKVAEDHNLSKADLCEHFNLSPNKYSHFITGHYNYSIKDLAVLNALHVKLASEEAAEEAAENAPVKFNLD